MEQQALFTAALINSQRGKKDKKVKPTDLFDRKKLEERREARPDSPEEALEKQRGARERAARLPVPLKLLKGGKDSGPSGVEGPVPPPPA